MSNVTFAPYLPVGAHNSGLTISSATIVTVPAGASGLLVQTITQNVRFVYGTATTVTASVGFQIKAGDPPVLIPAIPGQILQFIQEAATAVLQYQAVRTQDTVR